ncbi:MAG: gliding motility-associated ABC transporter ATP-binding subunit GldA [Bacteroidia bacterium]|jgi:ABC-2 type transport system ATP-binding protein|nr:gliding motility-associated ABC transporter ATP-binding subunit GldA [Bacteroidia bacterium]
MSVKVNAISKIYGTQKALDQVSFEIGSGQVIGFLGPNGAGKSTMMKIISCYIPQNSGTVTVNGFDTVEQSIEVRKLVGYLPEHNPLYLDMYVKEYLTFIAGLHMKQAQVSKSVSDMVDLTGLGPEQKKKIGALSKGYRQRVGLAQAMIHNPEVLILDEPTSGLDPNQLVDIRALISDIGKQKTVILSTHIMQEVEAICNRVIIINKGKIVADDKTEVIQQKTQPNSTLEVEFESEVSVALLKTLPGVSRIESQGTNKFKLISPAGTDLRSDLFAFAVANNLKVLTLQKTESSLEDVFHQLTSGKN